MSDTLMPNALPAAATYQATAPKPIQTQSAAVHNLVGELADMRALGVDVARISPQSTGTFEVIAAFDAARRGAIDGTEAKHRIAPHLVGEPCDGYWFGEPGIALHGGPARVPA